MSSTNGKRTLHSSILHFLCKEGYADTQNIHSYDVIYKSGLWTRSLLPKSRWLWVSIEAVTLRMAHFKSIDKDECETRAKEICLGKWYHRLTLDDGNETPVP